MKLERIDNKSRRIRKKLFLGEFAILGFEISCETDINDFDRYDVFVDDFVDYIDGLGHEYPVNFKDIILKFL